MLKFEGIITKIGKIEYVRERINSTHERKRKVKTRISPTDLTAKALPVVNAYTQI